ncbi:MAG: methyltransferase RsmF C-terminal domain-like protein [Bacteroidota bacterium]
MISIPSIFLQRISEKLGVDLQSFLDSYEADIPVSIRVNPWKPFKSFEGSEQVPWCETGLYLKERISFTLDPLFHAGCYYVQEASSMFIEAAFKKYTTENTPLRVLDLCGAPGGKSTHLLSLLPKGSLLVSNEPVPQRNSILRENLTKWGLDHVIITQNEPIDFASLKHHFDVILVDAPCSGEGLFRKNHEAVNEWSESTLVMCSLRQKTILKDVLPALKPKGLLIYSTCTYNEAENDGICEELSEAGLMQPLELEPNHGATGTKYGLQMYPHRVKGEGFFMAAMRKPDEEQEFISFKKGKNKNLQFKSANHWFKSAESYIFEINNDLLFAIPKSLEEEIALMRSSLYVRKAGICLGTLAGDDLIPTHELAMFVGRADTLETVDLSLEESLKYLRGEALSNNTQKKGWCLATYQCHALGWMKGVGNRFNNSYPKELRIRKL